jgi:hypothetical protein
MVADEQTRLASRKKLVEDSKPDVDYEQIQDERGNRDLVERQLDGWKSHESQHPDSAWSDGAYFPWKTYPTPLRDRSSIRLLFIFLAGLVIAFVVVFVVGYVLL